MHKAGIASEPTTSPHALAQEVLARYRNGGRALHDWLLQLEVQRYAASADGAARSRLRQLQRQYASLGWPG